MKKGGSVYVNTDICMNRVSNRLMFKIIDGYKLQSFS